MLKKEESEKMYMYCLEELRLLIDEGYCVDRLKTVKDTIELLHNNSKEDIPHYEQKILDMVKHRLINIGLKNYGKLDLKTDPRDFIKENLEEVGDCLVYTAIKLLQIIDRE